MTMTLILFFYFFPWMSLHFKPFWKKSSVYRLPGPEKGLQVKRGYFLIFELRSSSLGKFCIKVIIYMWKFCSYVFANTDRFLCIHISIRNFANVWRAITEIEFSQVTGSAYIFSFGNCVRYVYSWFERGGPKETYRCMQQRQTVTKNWTVTTYDTFRHSSVLLCASVGGPLRNT